LKSTFLPLLVVFAFLFFIIFLKSYSLRLRQVNIFSQRSELGSIPILCLYLGATIFQSSTQKVQLETTGPHSVYIFHLNAVICLIVFTSYVLHQSESYIRKHSALKYILIVMIVFQLGVNGFINGQLWDEYKRNTAIVNSLTTRTSELDRCRTLLSWQNRGWPKVYESSLVNGIDHFSRRVNGDSYCPSKDE
jgi:hypothetical protein